MLTLFKRLWKGNTIKKLTWLNAALTQFQGSSLFIPSWSNLTFVYIAFIKKFRLLMMMINKVIELFTLQIVLIDSNCPIHYHKYTGLSQ